MKLVATSKLKAAEQRMEEQARPFLRSVACLPEIQSLIQPVSGKVWKAPEDETKAKHHKVIVLTSDRGLCGSVNSNVLRLARRVLKEDDATSLSLTAIGGKGKAGLQREFAKVIDYAASELGDKKGVRFTDVVPIAEKVAISDADKVTLVCNTYESLLSFSTDVISVATPTDLAALDLEKYEFESDDKAVTMSNFYDWYVGAILYARVIENSATEMSARMTSMDNATRNAGDMINALEIQYNRRRQAAITTELTEIISGAEALADPEE
mmetsp:Transcript_16834/g.25147  ORF Transcript_16834/g.25147 Transcript_16834/m.25147 type:complete len:268 (-) Transcript_16834:43-846(-)